MQSVIIFIYLMTLDKTTRTKQQLLWNDVEVLLLTFIMPVVNAFSDDLQFLQGKIEMEIFNLNLAPMTGTIICWKIVIVLLLENRIEDKIFEFF
jgi:hypothetical protein